MPDKASAFTQLVKKFSNVFESLDIFIENKNEKTFYKFLRDYLAFKSPANHTLEKAVNSALVTMFDGIKDDDESKRIFFIIASHITLRGSAKFWEYLEEYQDDLDNARIDYERRMFEHELVDDIQRGGM